MQKIAFTNYSGGKDSHYALYRAIEDGFTVPFVFSFNASEIHHKIFNETLKIDIIKEQLKLMGIRLIEYKFAEYKIPFTDAVTEIYKKEIEKKYKNVTFYSSMDYEIKDRKDFIIIKDILNLFKKLRIKYISAVKNKSTVDMLDETMKLNIRYIITAIEKNIDSKWLGREVDESFVQYIKDENSKGNKIDANDFQTFVIKSPLFKKTLKIEKYEIISDNIFNKGSKLLKIKKFKFI